MQELCPDSRQMTKCVSLIHQFKSRRISSGWISLFTAPKGRNNLDFVGILDIFFCKRGCITLRMIFFIKLCHIIHKCNEWRSKISKSRSLLQGRGVRIAAALLYRWQIRFYLSKSYLIKDGQMDATNNLTHKPN